MTAPVVDKIRKLLALAESPNEHEAALAAERAQELMLRHGIDMAIVAAAADGAKSFDVDSAELHGQFDPWRRYLASAVCDATGGSYVWMTVPGSRSATIEFFGPAGTAEAVVALYRYLEAQLVTISAQATATRVDKRAHGRTWRLSFLYGAVNRINARLTERREAIESTDNAKALVVVKSAVDRAIEDKHGKLHTTPTSVSDIDSDAYAEGAEAGAVVDLRDRQLASEPAQLGEGR
jgi:hypothetical protein